MELNMETLQQIGGLYVSRDLCIAFVILLVMLFVAFSAIAFYHMAKKRTRRNQGLSRTFTTAAAAALVLMFIPAAAIPVIDIQLEQKEMSWGYEQLDAFEDEYDVKVPKADREKIASDFAAALSDSGTGTIVIDNALNNAYQPGEDDGKYYYTISITDQDNSGGFAYPYAMNLYADIEKSPCRGI